MSRGALRIVGGTMIAGFAAVTFGVQSRNFALLAVFELAALVVLALGIRDWRAEQERDREGE